MQELQSRAHRGELIACLFFFVLFVILCRTAFDYGVTWDEERHRVLGEQILRWYASFFQESSAITPTYGSLINALKQLIARISPFGIYETRHLLNAFLGFFAFIGTYRLASYISGRTAGILSVGFLSLTPRFYGHLFNNQKDIPFATFFILSLYYIVVSFDLFPTLSKKQIAKLGLCIGLAMAVSPAGIFLLLCLFLLRGAWFFLRRPVNSKSIRSIGVYFCLISFISWIIMILGWPWAQLNPLVNPVKSLISTTEYIWNLSVFFEGKYILAHDLPFHYLPVWFLITLPEFYFAAFASILFLRKRFDQKKKIQIIFLVFAFFVPLTVATLFRSGLNDGLRHFLFAIPILAVLSGVFCAEFFKTRFKLIKIALIGIILFTAAMTLFDMIQLHPYQAVYFNRLFGGGLKHASTLYETDYWGSSYKEGADWLIEHYQPDPPKRVKVANCSMKFQTQYYLEKTRKLRKRFKSVSPRGDPDIFLATTRWDCHLAKEGKILHQVVRQGTPLLYIIELKNKLER